ARIGNKRAWVRRVLDILAMYPPPVLIEVVVDIAHHVFLFEVGQQVGDPRSCGAVALDSFAEGKVLFGCLVVMKGKGEILEVVLAGGWCSRLSGRLQGGEKRRRQNNDDGEHNQVFNERETTGRPSAGGRVRAGRTRDRVATGGVHVISTDGLARLRDG